MADIKVTGDTERLENLGERVDEVIERTLLQAGFIVQRAWQKKLGKHTFDGTLRRSIATQVSTLGAQQVARVGSNLAYARAFHEGRRPGSMPPKNVLRRWITRRWGPEDLDEKEQALRWHIYKKGSPAHPYHEKALEDSRSSIQRLFERSLDEVAE